MATQYPHIFLQDTQASHGFTTPRKGGPSPIPDRNRRAHSDRLRIQWQTIWTHAKERDEARSAASMPTKDGVYVEFEGKPGFDLVTKSLEDRRSGIRLLNVYSVEDEQENQVTRATVYIPAGKQDLFLRKIREYAEQQTRKGNPKHDKLVRSVEDVRLAMLESFWRDDLELLPGSSSAEWCEVWLRDSDDAINSQFREISITLGIEVQPRSLEFPERTVLLAKATRIQLTELIEASSDLAELRKAKETARFFLELDNRDQTEWARDLRSRLRVASTTHVAVCVLDTGANNGHVLLEPLLADEDRHAADVQWGANDHGGHGTLMCGVAAYGDLLNLLQNSGEVRVNHSLESVKILPPAGENDPDLYGSITIQAISRAEIQAPRRSHIGCMAVTSEDGRDRGRPSSWSAAIDKLTSGADDGTRRLFILAAGNIHDNSQWANYPNSNYIYSIHDPGQSWNALTVGAYTEKSRLTDVTLADHRPLAKPGELSPFSSTSLTWEQKWPSKPDIVLEGGNLAQAPDGYISQHDDLSILSTGHQPTRRQFDLINATSAAAAEAAHMAAIIQTTYPDAWPETVRGLLVHSARWPKALRQQFLGTGRSGEYSKTEYGRLLRVCGYGVPDLSMALSCPLNSVTLVTESELQPYTRQDVGSGCKTKDMHLHQLPWPKDVLLSLGEMPVSLRITLSYFIEPGPGEIGWRDKYRYASYALRFDLNNTGETEDSFLRRINAAAREDGDEPDTDSGSQRWSIGASNRNSGSIHSDIWNGTAADLASCNIVGVYPVIGWWRERTWLNRWDGKARYTLIVSLETPDESVDVYTPVAIQVGIPVEVMV